MNQKFITYFACAVALCGSVWAAESVNGTEKDAKDGEAKPVELEESDDIKWVSGSAGIAYDSKYMSYGLVDGKDPIMTPKASLGFFDDLLTFETAWLMDTTHNSRKYGYGNRQWQYFEADFEVTLDYTFSADDYDWLPTSVNLGADYMYEYHPRRAKCKNPFNPGHNVNPDTQFVSLYAGLPDLWFEPLLTYERDIMRDDGTYVSLEIGHTFALIDGAGEDDDPELGLRPVVSQGFGDSKRMKGYLFNADGDPMDHSGMMDTMIKLELAWKPFDWLEVTPYVAYYDFLLDSNIRDNSRLYEPGCTGGHRKDTSYHFVAGLAASASF